MDPATIIAMADAAVAFLETAVPHIVSLFQKGEITKEQQQALLDKVNKLQENNFAFTRPPGT